LRFCNPADRICNPIGVQLAGNVRSGVIMQMVWDFVDGILFVAGVRMRQATSEKFNITKMGV
jgi:hypothetical protein